MERGPQLRTALFAILIILIGVNIFVLISNSTRGRGEEAPVVVSPPRPQPASLVSAEFYDAPCPELDLFVRGGPSISTKNHIGEVLLIRFTRFHKQDFPKLLFLEHLRNKYHEHGIRLMFISLIEKNFPELVLSDPDFASPIIDDDGSLHGIFNARLNDLIIVGRDFRIKFKHNNAGNAIIYRQVLRQLFGDEPPPKGISEEGWLSIIEKMNFINIDNNKTKKYWRFIKGSQRHAAAVCFTLPQLLDQWQGFSYAGNGL